jgi:Ca2+-binding EF-hand superfamily protein
MLMQAKQITPWFGLAAASVLTVAMVMSIPAHAGEGDKGQEAQAVPAFTKLDTNHDGFVDLNEAKKLPGLLEIFDKLDANHDGKLSAEEISQVQAKNRAKDPAS